MRGLVIKNTGSWYTVRTDDGRDIESKIKGNFRLKDIRTTNPVAVGDRVNIDINAEGTAFITEIEDRKKKAEAEKQLSPLGEMIRDIEEFCPAEYYKDKKLYADFDHLKEYIERFMTRPLRNLLTGSKELDKEFSLSDSEE